MKKPVNYEMMLILKDRLDELANNTAEHMSTEKRELIQQCCTIAAGTNHPEVQIECCKLNSTWLDVYNTALTRAALVTLACLVMA